uniref:Uncharacterized protein n=1 Tax=Cacopsylla melanoneura TaxID=428564 RepID=A0A8D8Z6Y8_9HEMI
MREIWKGRGGLRERGGDEEIEREGRGRERREKREGGKREEGKREKRGKFRQRREMEGMEEVGSKSRKIKIGKKGTDRKREEHDDVKKEEENRIVQDGRRRKTEKGIEETNGRGTFRKFLIFSFRLKASPGDCLYILKVIRTR